MAIRCPMEPGNRKSSVVQAIANPIREFEKEIRRSVATAVREARTACEIRLKQRAKLIEDIAKAPIGPDRDAFLHDLQQLEEEIATNPIPTEPVLLADDCTPEHLATLMSQNNGRLGVLTAEGDLFDILAGRYSGQPNIGIVLKAHSGDEVRVDRGTQRTRNSLLRLKHREMSAQLRVRWRTQNVHEMYTQLTYP